MSQRVQRTRKMTMNGERAFTLVELLVAIVLLAVGILSVVTMFPLANRNITHSRANAKATAYAQEKTEDLQNKAANDADLAAGTHNDTGNPVEGLFTRSWTVADNNPLTGCKRVTVSVSWTEEGLSRTIQVITFLASSGR